MTDDWKTALEHKRILGKKEYAEKKAKKAYFDGLGPIALTGMLHRKLNLPDIEDAADVIARLERQALALDTVFFNGLHNAGLGQTAALANDPLKTALSAQKQCRQVFDSLKSEKTSKFRKQKEGPEK
jgi:hypothetical protein